MEAVKNIKNVVAKTNFDFTKLILGHRIKKIQINVEEKSRMNQNPRERYVWCEYLV